VHTSCSHAPAVAQRGGAAIEHEVEAMLRYSAAPPPAAPPPSASFLFGRSQQPPVFDDDTEREEAGDGRGGAAAEGRPRPRRAAVRARSAASVVGGSMSRAEMEKARALA